MDALLPIIHEIGGGLSAVVMVGLAWLWWQERKGREADRERHEAFRTEKIEASIRREVDMQVTLQRMADVLASLQSGRS